MIMSDEDIHISGKIIKLEKLKPGGYRPWVVQTEATLEVHGCLEIVLGTELKPSEDEDEDGSDLFTAHLAIKSWLTRHALGRQALLAALEPNDLMNVVPVSNDASAIWLRLKDKYGKSLDFEYIRVNSEFQSLREDRKTSLNDHINEFNRLLQAVNYNRPPEIPAFTSAAVNLSFLQSLGPDFPVWGMAKGEMLRRTPTAELMAEVRALTMRGKEADATDSSQDINANAANFNSQRDDNHANSGGK
jgi:hypothetical protein